MRHQLLLTTAFGILTATQAVAQTAPAYSPDTVRQGDKTYTYVEQHPEFPGGQAAMFKAIGQNIYYPTEALQNEVEGKVFVSFVVGTSGAVEEVKVSRGVHPLLDAAAVRAVELLPAFTPGKQAGRLIRVAYTVPIVFMVPANVKQILKERAAKPSNTPR